MRAADLDLDSAPVQHTFALMREHGTGLDTTVHEPGEPARYDAAFAKVLETLRRLHAQGTPLWPGTDDPIGFTLHRELELYTQVGLSPAEALRVATSDCDRYLGRDQLYGSITRGKRADLFLIPGDPTRDINAIRQIRMVMKDGVIFYPSEIYKALGVQPFAAPPPVVSKAAVPVGQTAAASAFTLTRNGFSEIGGDDGAD